MSTPENVSVSTSTAPAVTPISALPAAPATIAENGAAGSPQADNAGVPFDPAKHIAKINRLTGRWMPRGGRKRASVAPSVEATPTKLPDAPPPDFSDLKKILEATPGGEKTPEAVDSGPPRNAVDHSTDAGEVGARLVQLSAGIILDAPDDTVATPAEHKHMVESTAAFVRSRGWQAAAGVGLALMFAAWLLKVLQKPAPLAKVRSWFGPGEAARNVTPDNARPADSSRRATPAAASSVTDIPPNIPPLARS